VTLLVISPDYASHLLPLLTLATAWRDAGERVVVATGPATAAIVGQFGFERVNLQLGKGSNPGVIRAEQQPKGEDDALRGFFDATRRGMVATLSFQAEARLSDFMWEPVRIGREVLAVVESVAPDDIIVDHLAFSARLALDSAGIRYGDVVVGHPSALPVAGEVYGYPPEWPAAFAPDREELARLRELCERVSASFTAEWNAALAELNPAARPSASAFEEHGAVLLYNYPAELGTREGAVHLGSAVREEEPDAEVEAWLAESAEPFVYVSFGSFLSVRSDVLARVAAALSSRGLRAAIALGSAERADLGELPPGWLVREFLPQVRLLGAAAAAVTHGGNNSVTEAMTFGVPLLVLPFSTDQFAGAAALERAGFGVALAPNEATVDELADGIDRVLALPRGAIDALGADLRQRPGSVRALEAVSSRIADGSPEAAR
jgi:UDP:flavonoid glycosyltransferase YjiC (YdhE family)